MVEDPVLNELLERACPSIQYRLRLELLNQPRSAVHLQELQGQDPENPVVQEAFSQGA
jgi:hypothetical protein